jgi:hypothetical protein
MASAYRVQIIDAETGKVVYHEHPGLRAEAELIANLQGRVRAKGVGIGRSEDQVVARVAEAMHELLLDLKQTIPPKRP